MRIWFEKNSRKGVEECRIRVTREIDAENLKSQASSCRRGARFAVDRGENPFRGWPNLSRSFVFGVECRLASVPTRDSRDEEREERVENQPSPGLHGWKGGTLVRKVFSRVSLSLSFSGDAGWLASSWLLCMPERKSLLATLTCSFLDSLFGQLHSASFLYLLFDARSLPGIFGNCWDLEL